MKKPVVIAVLDTGVSEKLCGQYRNIDLTRSRCFECSGDEVTVKRDIYDRIGHGTAVTHIICSEADNAVIIPFRIITDDAAADEAVLDNALEYILNNVDCDIINVSIGVCAAADKQYFYSLCRKLLDRGTLMVSAFDNGGDLSYPAAFDCVYGISTSFEVPAGKFLRTDDTEVNFILPAHEERVPWVGDRAQTVSGNSFAAAHFSAYLAGLLPNYASKAELDRALVSNASGLRSYASESMNKCALDIKKAALFPFNKEMHALARFEDMLPFDIVSVYDAKYSLNLNKSVRDVIGAGSESLIIRNIDKIRWDDDFDTVICGHTETLSMACRTDFMASMIENCAKYSKQLFSFSDIGAEAPDNLKFYCPGTKLLNKGYYKNTCCAAHPVLGVVGTGSRQGKYSLELSLYRALTRRGYGTGFLCTEPSGALFGAECVYPCGYENATHVSGLDAVYVINRLLKRIDDTDPDIILFGGQSQTIPNDSGGLKQFTSTQSELLQACAADAYILCVSCEDDIDYVRRTVAYLEALHASKVLAIVISPIKSGLRWSVLSHAPQKAEARELDAMACLCAKTGIPVYSGYVETFIDRLTDAVTEYFS